LAHKEKIAPRRFLAPQTSLGMTRLLALQNTAPRLPWIEKFTNSERSEAQPRDLRGAIILETLGGQPENRFAEIPRGACPERSRMGGLRSE